jgi:hypothetical protein
VKEKEVPKMKSKETVKLPLTDEQKKKRNKKIFKYVGIWTSIAAVLVTIYWAAIKYVLVDYQNMAYLTFSYEMSRDGKTEEIRIDAVDSRKNYPAKFIVPKKLLGRPVTQIGDHAFAGLERLKEVVLPNTIHTLGDGAFLNCTNLSKIKLSENITDVGINALDNTPYFNNFPDGFLMLGKVLYAYKGLMPNNTVLIERDAPNEQELIDAGFNVLEYNGDVVNIGSGLFANQPGLVEAYMPTNVTKITPKIFLNNPNLRKVVLSENVTHIGTSAFENTPMLTNININNIENIEEIGEKAFSNSGLTGDIVLNGTFTKIEEATFAWNENVTSYHLPETLQIIGRDAFKNNTNLASINLPDSVFDIQESAFENSALVNVDLPKQMITVKNKVFYGSSKLEKVTIHETWTGTYSTIDIEGNIVEVEGTVAFRGLREESFANTPKLKTFGVRSDEGNLLTPLNEVHFNNETSSFGNGSFLNSGIEKVVIPRDLKNISRSVFEGATELSHVDFSTANSLNQVSFAAFRNTPSLKNVALPDTVTTIEDAAFQQSGILSFVLPPSVNTLNSYTFSDASNLASVTFNNELLTIEEGTFKNCTSLTTLTLPSSIRRIHEGAFSGTTNLTSIVIPNDANLTPDNMYGAFKDATGLVSFDVADNFITLYDFMFEGATSLSELNFNATSKLKAIGKGTFKGTTNLTNIRLPKTVTSVGEDAFLNNGWFNSQPDGLTYLKDSENVDFLMYKYKGQITDANNEIVIPEGVRILGNKAFANQTKLKKITLPSTLEIIAVSAFEGASGLEEVVIAPNSNLEIIDANAFKDCTSLKSFSLPDTVKEIRNRAFSNNTSLRTFTVNPTSTLERLEAYAFAGCRSLEGFYLPPTITRVEGFCFQGCTSLTFYKGQGYEVPVPDVYMANWNPENRPIVEV